MSDKNRCRFWLIMSIMAAFCVASRIWDLIEARKDWGELVSALIICFLCVYFYIQNRKKLAEDNNSDSADHQ